jgi:hypothetical protein
MFGDYSVGRQIHLANAFDKDISDTLLQLQSIFQIQAPF